ncbi:hypothetical protein H8K55_09015 [Undibacterium sp. LX15W]|uniref:General secretion pathway protein GspD n=2 Tax=Undibacterium flavidum TaxID=2762297 RepID=A0ABR6YAX1_9BURK|nr:hypothetical protein [Undibacterium flavidum]
MQNRHALTIQDVKAALNQNDTAFAANKLRELLIENPNNAEARTMQQSLQEKIARPALETALATSFKKPITIEFKDVALKQVFEVISRTSGLNFLFDKDVKTDQKTSIFLKNSTIESAVHFTLLTNQLEQQILDASTILIYPNTPAKLKDYQEMMVKTFFLANAEAKSVATTLKTILKIRDIVVDEKLNLMIVRDSPDAIRLAEKIIAMQDVPEPEVMLEVEILEIKRSRLQELGIKWPDSLNLIPLPSIAGGSLTLRDLKNNVNSGTVSAGIGNLTVNAKKQDSDVNLLANPRIRARNHEKAKIMIGERVPNVTTTTSGTFVSDSIAYLDVGLTLNVEPTVYLDNDVAIKVSMEVSSIVSQFQTKNGSSAYTIGTRSANTVLRLRDGENQVLAGLINDEDRRSATKIPFLGEVPILGRLFSTNADNNTKNEIVLSITPHIIRNIQRPIAAVAEFRSGTDSSFRTRPDSGSGSAIVTTQTGNGSTSTENTSLNNHNTNNNNGSGSNPNAGLGQSNYGQNQGIGNVLNNPIPVSTQNNPISGSKLTWQGPTQTKVGEIFTLQLQMQSDQSINSLPLNLSYDTKALQLVGVSEGTFLKQGGAQTNFTSRVDPNGPIFISTTRLGDGSATSNGIVMIINFKAIATSEASTVQVLSVTPTTAIGQIVSTALPTPFSIKILP